MGERKREREWSDENDDGLRECQSTKNNGSLFVMSMQAKSDSQSINQPAGRGKGKNGEQLKGEDARTIGMILVGERNERRNLWDGGGGGR